MVEGEEGRADVIVMGGGLPKTEHRETELKKESEGEIDLLEGGL